MSAAASQNVHSWEVSGVGVAPFVCVGVYSIPSTSLGAVNPDAYAHQLKEMPKGFGCGQCAVCGTGLTHNFLMRDANGKTFSVGCDCVEKSGDRGLITQVEATKRKQREEARAAERMARYQAIKDQEQAERDRNGGMTDAEKLQAEADRLVREKALRIADLMMPVSTELNRAGGGFASEMKHMINDGRVPTGRARQICCEIFAKAMATKATGKSRGKAHAEAMKPFIDQAQALFAAADAENN